MVIIDVRTKEEFDAGHIDGALLCDIRDMMRGIFPDVSKAEKIILYCESGNRAMMAQAMMEKEGYTDVTNGGSMSECIQNIASK